MTLTRFHDAQNRIWPAPLNELEAGRKRTHWMWFVFPQLRGLGRSDMAQAYGLDGLDEARAYLADPVLAGRLEACARAMLRHRGRPPEEILGEVDAMTLRSSATLFAQAGHPASAQLLAVFGGPDSRTLALLAG